MQPFTVVDTWNHPAQTTRVAPEGRGEVGAPVTWPGLSDRRQVLVHEIGICPDGQYHVAISFKNEDFYTVYQTVSPADEEGSAAVRALADSINQERRAAAQAQARAQAFHDGSLGAE